jgi:hypothetical protein
LIGIVVPTIGRRIVWALVMSVGNCITGVVAAVAIIRLAVAVIGLAVAVIAGWVARVSNAPAQRARQHECGERDQSAPSRCELLVSHDVILAFIDTHVERNESVDQATQSLKCGGFPGCHSGAGPSSTS